MTRIISLTTGYPIQIGQVVELDHAPRGARIHWVKIIAIDALLKVVTVKDHECTQHVEPGRIGVKFPEKRPRPDSLPAELGVPGHASTEQFARSMGHARAGMPAEQAAALYKMDLNSYLDVTYRHLAVSDDEFTLIVAALKHLAERSKHAGLTTLIEKLSLNPRSTE